MSLFDTMPRLGLGTWQLTGDAAVDTVAAALQMGYRHLDTAVRYENEREVGAGLRQSGISRDEVFVTTKIWFDSLSPAAMRDSAAASLERLQLDNVDLLLIHWPSVDENWHFADSLHTLAELKQQGLARHIGVANFPLALLREARQILGDELAANQVEYHVGLAQNALLPYMQQQQIMLTAYCPLARGQYDAEPSVLAIAEKHGIAPSQVVLAWLLSQDGVAAIPRSSKIAHLQSNLAAAKVTLDKEEVRSLAALGGDFRIIDPDFAPKWDK